MELESYVASLRRELMVNAAVGGAEAEAIAERLVAPLESSVRLVLLKALSSAAQEISRDLPAGSVELRLSGLDPSFVVTSSPVPPADEEYVAPTTADDGATARINFRPPEQLKSRIEEAAGREGMSVNAWLVRSVSATLNRESRRPIRRAPRGGDHQSGWAR
ncbi:hypothetical protein [Tenggerimyces flavus]|uniref:Uncharacterized protein n=1 Tax=Tenggerimyces flavus TaxID=1708749 RepID=A0ABV7YLF2_9ACTN|nr:hypothetical protein [Tenggerimyces flavus]MBM7789895.1 hypothetical protein [Tenggerimyces flavus]